METEAKENVNELVSQREIVELIGAVRALTVEVKELNEANRKLYEDINGNGKKGLKREVEELRTRLRLVYGGAIAVFGPLTAYVVIQVFQYFIDLVTHYGKPPSP